jgi:serine/threonine protein kinase
MCAVIFALIYHTFYSVGVIVYILLGGCEWKALDFFTHCVDMLTYRLFTPMIDPPFYAETEKELFRLTRMGEFEFHEENWSHISSGAKDLIIALLQTNPTKRATAADVLKHPWMNADKKLLKMQNLGKSQINLKNTLAKTRFRKAIHSVSHICIICPDAARLSLTHIAFRCYSSRVLQERTQCSLERSIPS